MDNEKWVNKDLIAQRKKQYGNNFPQITKQWNAYLTKMYPQMRNTLTISDTIKMMALMKKTRILNQIQKNGIVSDIDDYNNYIWISDNYQQYLSL